MKKQNQVRENTSRNSAVLQPQTEHSGARDDRGPKRPKPGPSSPVKGGLTFVIVRPDGGEWGRADFTSSERHAMELACKKSKVTLRTFFKTAMLDFLDSREMEAA